MFSPFGQSRDAVSREGHDFLVRSLRESFIILVDVWGYEF